MRENEAEENKMEENKAVESRAEENSKENGAAVESDPDVKNNAGYYSRYLEYGIYIENGLFNVAGNLKLYLDIVEMFIYHKGKQAQLKQFITDKNAKGCTILVHALKEEARMLGAEGLGDLAYEHEKQSKAGDLAYVEEHWDELVECWNRALEGFEEFCRESGREQEAASMMAVPVTNEDSQTFQVTPEEMEEVILWLDAFETTMAEEKMKEWLQKPLNPEQRTIIANALTTSEKEFDYERAIEILENH